MNRLVLAALAATAASTAAAETVRIATFNASLNRGSEGQLVRDLSTPDNDQARKVAEVIQRVNPDILLLNEFDYDAGGQALRLFQQNYLSVAQNGTAAGSSAPVSYAHSFAAPSNTGVASGLDLDNNGAVGTTPGAADYANDAFGFGFFPGQFGMAVLSKFDIDEAAARTFQTFKWTDMPGAMLPDDPATPTAQDFYSAEELEVFRLSSKSHWDLPITVDGTTIHLLASHPTPPVFDGPEDRNGLRNSDEIRLWADYIAGGDYIYDDAGVFGGLADGAAFVIAGDQNADPFDGDSTPPAISQLLQNPLINTAVTPSSAGGAEAAALQGQNNAGHLGDPAFDTADFGETPFGPGNIRADYVLPSAGLEIVDAGVFWPVQSDPLSALTGVFPFPTSDHRLVWIDVTVDATPAPIPLPAGGWLLLGGFGALGLLRRRA
jgi:hypothetical protein